MESNQKEREFYTPYGWKGSRYEDTQKLDLKEIAQRIKKEILAKHPEIKVSVSTKHFSGGSEVNVWVTAYPNSFLKREIVEHFRKEFGDMEPSKVPSYAWVYNYTPEAKALLEDLKKIANQYRYDDSDGMIDYFSTNFYCDPEFHWELRSAEEKRLGIFGGHYVS